MPASARSRRYARSSRSITACMRAGFSKVTESRAPRARSRAMVSSSTTGRTMISGTSGAKRSRTLAIVCSSLPSWLTQTSSSGLICTSASARSCSPGIHVQCAGMPLRRSRLLSASTGSRAVLATTRGTAGLSGKWETPGMLWKIVNHPIPAGCEAAHTRGTRRGGDAANPRPLLLQCAPPRCVAIGVLPGIPATSRTRRGTS